MGTIQVGGREVGEWTRARGGEVTTEARGRGAAGRQLGNAGGLQKLEEARKWMLAQSHRRLDFRLLTPRTVRD